MQVAESGNRRASAAVIQRLEESDTQEQSAGSTQPSAADAAVASAASKAVPGKELKASAPAFVPTSVKADASVDMLAEQAKNILSMAAARGEAKQAAAAAKADMMSRLPESHKRMLRGYYQDVMGNFVSYYVGNLKSYSSRAGYGFLECVQSQADFGMDVFIHKNAVGTPWHVGQPCEFAVCHNSRGQPQACDVKWLPLLPQHKATANGYGGYNAGSVMGTFSAAAPMPAQARGTSFSSSSAAESYSAAPAAGGGMSTQASPDGASKEGVPPAGASPEASGGEQEGAVEQRYLGALKSYSPAQGYGFLTCDEIWSAYSRDTYFDKSQMLKPVWNIGQTVEFSVTLNARNQPQARSINWEPVPTTPKDDKPGSEAQGLQKPRSHQPQTLAKFKKILGYLNSRDLETAVVTAIDFQGGVEKKTQADVDYDIDFVSYVLDRAGDEVAGASRIKAFVQLLLMLMLVKMLRRKHPTQRREQLVRWVDVLSRRIDPNSEGVKEHYKDVSKQICTHIDAACAENQGLATALMAAAQCVKAKGEGAPETAPTADGLPTAAS